MTLPLPIVNPIRHADGPRSSTNCGATWLGTIGITSTSSGKVPPRHTLDATDAPDMAGWEHDGGFSLDASVHIAAPDRPGLEQRLRYCARPPFALDRLRELDPEHLVYDHGNECPVSVWRDGRSGSGTVIRPLTMSGGRTVHSGPSHLYDCCTLFSGRSGESGQRRQSTPTRRPKSPEPVIEIV